MYQRIIILFDRKYMLIVTNSLVCYIQYEVFDLEHFIEYS